MTSATKSFSVFFVLLSVLLLSVPLFTVDAQRNIAAGIGLRPAVIEDSADPGEVLEQQVTVANLSNSSQTYYLFLRDISGVQTGGVPIFADENAERTGYELTEWVELDQTELTLDPGEEKAVLVTIRVPENATPGSHFGGVFVSLDPPRMRSTGASVAYEVANIISIRVAGDAIENAQIRSFSTGNYIYSEPSIDFMARVENKGSVLVRPMGPLEIHNMFGSRVAVLTFNESQAGVFPLTTRDFELTWKSDEPGFGRYQAVLSLIYGGEGRQSTISSTLTFWILPMNIILPALGVLAALLLVTYISVRMYIRRTVRSMAGTSRRLVNRRRGNGMSALLLVTVVMLAVTALFLIILLALFA